MCPPAHISSVAEIDEYWTDEGVLMSLMKFKSGGSLPLNVTSDVDPYQFWPSDLPGDMWYFCSSVKKDAENGFWLAMGEACEIFSNSAIIGLRTTLRFYEGQGQKTNWMMQEYKTTEKCNNNLKDSRALCRVFLADENRLLHPEPPSRNCIAEIDVTDSIDSEPKKTDPIVKSGSELVSTSELLEKDKDNGIGPSLMARSSPQPDSPVENLSEMDYVLTGDYLELDDLADPISRSSSSANSSCFTMTSEEYFDSMALLRELEDDSKDSSVKLNLSASVKSKEVAVRPPTLESLRSCEDQKPCTDKSSKVDHTDGNKQDHRRSQSPNTTASSSGSEDTSKEEKKDRVGRTKRRKMMKYLCFMAF